MRKLILASVLVLAFVHSALAQAPNETEGAYIACEGVRRSCSRTPLPSECTKARIENCRVIGEAWTKIQAEQRANHQSKSIDGVAEQLKQKAKP